MSFKNIIGQDIAIRILRNLILQEQVRGAFLFLGPDGVGKHTVAVEVAKALTCERMQPDACEDCIPCNKINSMNHPDVFSISPEGPPHSIKIEKIREIIYQANLKPYEGKVRIFIINDSEAMTEEAQNALLKLLEEPAANQILILTAYNIAGLFPTVVSRCKVLKFNSLSQSQIEEFLKAHNTDEKNAILFSHMAMGSIGRALRFKEKGIILRRDEVLNDFFFRKSVLLNEDVLNEQMQKDTEESVHILLYWYRDLLISKFTQEECLLLNADRFGELSSYAHKFSREKLQKDILTLMETIGYLRKNINPKIALFNMALGLKRN